MLLKKQGYPEEDELVLCTVTNIHFHSVFVKLDEYEKSGMLHISEVSPGRIRNIRDYVKEGKKIVCKVLKINTEKGHIDVSLRRVNESQRRNKLAEIKQEQLAESIVEFVAKKHKKDVQQVYKKITGILFKNFSLLYDAFEQVSNEELNLEKEGVDKAIAKDLTEVIQQRIKPPEVFIKGDFEIKSFDPNGIEIIKEAFKKAKVVKGEYDLKYKGGGLYSLVVKAEDYQDAESVVEKIKSAILDHIEGQNAEAKFVRAK